MGKAVAIILGIILIILGIMLSSEGAFQIGYGL